jgi:hypothetical protein
MTEREMKDLWQLIGNLSRVAMVVPLDKVQDLARAIERRSVTLDPQAQSLVAAFERFREDIEPLHASEVRRVGAQGVAWVQ